ncbi:hypothetical protein C9I89_04685 [Photobacterium lipolyticum]|uniref:Uncharacterized protein n=2 Tax=Photobacterium lipolyticum TaxID=266810 RepID=A0A2T3N387_9GAMM|nr:hypothetical protein C9I89_04685 [Photobacterium lipolyticum]
MMLQLAGVVVQKEWGEPAANLPLKKLVKQCGKAHGINLSFDRLNCAKIHQEHLPLAFRLKNGGFVVLARISEEQALIQAPDAVSPSRACGFATMRMARKCFAT